ncbi:MAG: CinA family protein [Bacteroidaceae bacterium]|nr:CinA family protein [Bacteroidaceae bacterium]
MTTDSEDIELAERLRIMMVERGKTVSTAESCTSGRIASTLTSVSGASDYFLGGLVAYQDEVKIAHLGVTAEMIAKHDVVSREVVEQMVRGACRFFGSDYALASTGYAGGGTESIPSGTIWIGWGSDGDVHSLRLSKDEGREKNTSNAAKKAIQSFIESLETLK